MALRGNLRDFSLPDVFQLVQLSGKTGVLRIQGPEADGSIWFRDGEVFFAQSNWRREQLGERLVAAQRITPAALARALDLRSAEPAGGRRLGEILVNEGYITPQVLETFVQEQIQDTIFDLMRWDEGEFDFEVLPEIVHEDIGLSVSIENIVMEGSRRLEEWQRIKKKVPSTEMVFKMATAPGEGTFEISLKPVEWALLLLIDGTRSVRELAVETHSTDFDVARVIYGLFSAGLLEVPADDEIERLRADRTRREDKRAKLDAERATREAALPSVMPEVEAQPAVEPSIEPAPAEPVFAPASGELEDVASEAAEPKHVPEEPEFLAAPGETPSADDMAVFEQMMASVLTPQGTPGPEVIPPAPEAVPVEPEPVPFGPEDVTLAPSVPVEPEAVPLEPEFETFPVEPEPDLMADLGFYPEPPAPPAFESEFTPGIDFQPEAPAAEPETPYVPYAPAFEPEEQLGPDLSGLSLAEIEALAAPQQPEPAKSGDFEADLRSLGLGEYPEELLQPPSETRLPMSEIEAERPEENDLDSLLASLGGGPTEPTDAAGIIASETEYGEQTESADGYISTDAFLAEFDDSTLSAGLGDELTALTGGATGRARPVATVNKIPEVGETQVLHRDQMVDRALLEQIIEGIENL